ncbi:MAG: right-handed parallel beta-helix repeat-containing protein [Phycisphaeraceae bacterium]
MSIALLLAAGLTGSALANPTADDPRDWSDAVQTPIPIPDGEADWHFGDPPFAGLPRGEQVLAGIRWQVPESSHGMIILGRGADEVVRDIPVGRKADTLAFLHTAAPGQGVLDWFEREQQAIADRKLPEPGPTMLTYVVRYEDGSRVEIPVRWNEGIQRGMRVTWRPLEGFLRPLAWADIAWEAVPDTPGARHMVVYAMHWPNPYPDKAIESLDVVASPNHDDFAVVLGVTAIERPSRGDAWFVSPEGSDDNPGTFDAPWKSPAKAAAKLQPGDVLYFRGGTYRPTEVIQPVRSGEPGAWISLVGWPGETPIINGRAVPIGDVIRTGVVHSEGNSYIRFKNLTVTTSPCEGIASKSAAHHLDFLYNTVYYTANSGIGAWRGEDPPESTHHVRAIGNQLYSTCARAANQELLGRDKRGGDECLDAGGISDFEYAYNLIAYGDKESIDCKGPVRRGRIHHNYVHHTGSIYMDSWNHDMFDLEIDHNVNHDSYGGFKLSTEGGSGGRRIRFHHNLAYDNLAHGLTITDFGETRGRALKENLHITNNTFANNGGYGIFIEGMQTFDTVVRNNIAVGNKLFQIGVAGQDLAEQHIEIDHNLISSMEITGDIDSARVVRGEGSILGEAMFKAPEAGDFRLQPDSPAVDAGHPAERYADPDGSRNDIGAYWHGPRPLRREVD